MSAVRTKVRRSLAPTPPGEDVSPRTADHAFSLPELRQQVLHADGKDLGWRKRAIHNFIARLIPF